MMQQPLEESMGGSYEPMLMEGDEGDNVAIRQHRHLLITGYDPLQCLSPQREKTVLDETFHVGVDDVRVAPCIHEDVEAEGWGLYQRWKSEGKEP
jgi:hypothetical protein